MNRRCLLLGQGFVLLVLLPLTTAVLDERRGDGANRGGKLHE
jgi:hypothetical protein